MEELPEIGKPTRELDIGEIVTMTFGVYSERFIQYLVPFLVAGAITGILTTVISSAIVIPATPPSGATQQETFAWLYNYLVVSLVLASFVGIVGWIINEITQGIPVK